MDFKTRAALEALITNALSQEGIELGDDGAPIVGAEKLQLAAPAVLAHLVSALDEDAGDENEIQEEIEESTNPIVDDALASNLGEALTKYVEVTETGENIQIDAEFMKKRGGELIGDLFSAFAKSIVPNELRVEVPGSTKESPRHVTLDFSALFSGRTATEEE